MTTMDATAPVNKNICLDKVTPQGQSSPGLRYYISGYRNIVGGI